MKKILVMAIAVSIFSVVGVQSALADVDGAKVFKKKCKMCHALSRKKVGPAVKNMNTDKDFLKLTIMKGRKMMPRFAKKLDAAQIDAVVEYLISQQAAEKE